MVFAVVMETYIHLTISILYFLRISVKALDIPNKYIHYIHKLLHYHGQISDVLKRIIRLKEKPLKNLVDCMVKVLTDIHGIVLKPFFLHDIHTPDWTNFAKHLQTVKSITVHAVDYESTYSIYCAIKRNFLLAV